MKYGVCMRNNCLSKYVAAAQFQKFCSSDQLVIDFNFNLYFISKLQNIENYEI